MSCGVCHPSVFRSAPGARVYGYAVFRNRRSVAHCAGIPNLHFMGAETVFTDFASGRLLHRPGYQLLSKLLRSGDRLILDDEVSLGTKPGYRARNITRIEEMGVEVMVLTKVSETMRLAA